MMHHVGSTCYAVGDIDMSATSTVSGTVYSDANQNGLFDSGEIGIPNSLVTASDTIHTFTDPTGQYLLHLPPGTHTVRRDYYNTDPAWWAATNPVDDSIVVDVADTTAYAGINFGVYVDGGVHDVGIQAFGDNPAPGFESTTTYIVSNTGNGAENVTLTINHDPNLEFVSSNPAPTSINIAEHQLTYNATAPPGYSAVYAIYQTPTTLTLGTAVTDSFDVVLNGETDADLSNNYGTMQTTVVGSFDPNDKQAKEVKQAIKEGQMQQLQQKKSGR